jgi:hypothetical protein
MRQSHVALLMLLVLPAAPTCMPAAAADDFKVMKLEQDMRNIERQVQDLSRQLNELQQRASRASDRPSSAPSSSAAPAPSTDWLNADAWRRVRPGMTELEVLELLGPPTSMRGAADSGTRQLLYAMEIGSSGFLGGSVLLKDRRVAEIQVPTLR